MNETPDNQPLPSDDELKHILDRGAEPYWMQDVRAATRRIEAQRSSPDNEVFPNSM